jgi:hypothetical protein
MDRTVAFDKEDGLIQCVWRTLQMWTISLPRAGSLKKVSVSDDTTCHTSSECTT